MAHLLADMRNFFFGCLDHGAIKQVGTHHFINHRMRFGILNFGTCETGDIDAVLITNAISKNTVILMIRPFHNVSFFLFLLLSSDMLGLPYLTEYTNFRGKIFLTEPTLQTGMIRLL